MDFVRQIIEPDKLAGIIDIPEKLKRSTVEVIILPTIDDEESFNKENQQNKEKYKALYENPIKVDKIKIFSRDELHDR
jgi:hypothetical protein